MGLLSGWVGHDFFERLQETAREKKLTGAEALGTPQGLMEGFVEFANRNIIKPAIAETRLATQGITTGSENDGTQFDLIRDAIVTEISAGTLVQKAEKAFPVDYIGIRVDVGPEVRAQAVKVVEKLFGIKERKKFYLEEAELEVGGVLEQTLEGATFIVKGRSRAAINTAKMSEYCDFFQITVAKSEQGNPWLFTVEDWAETSPGSTEPKWLTEKGEKLWQEKGQIFASGQFKPNPLFQAGE